MLYFILACHLTFAACLAVVFISRAVLIVKKKNNQYLRKLFYAFSGSLVVSGVLLSVVGKLQITTICLESLALVAVVSLLDFVLVYFNKKQEQIN